MTVRVAFLCLVALGWALPGVAAAQTTGSDLGRQLERPLRRAPAAGADEDEDGDGDEDEEELRWPGPQIQLGYGYMKLADGFGGGDAHTGAVLVFVQWPVHELRTAVLGEIGSRGYSLAGDDLIVRGGLEVGFQLPHLVDPFVPHISAVMSVGALVGERFETTVTHVYAGGGIEIGAELRLVRNLHLAAAFAYQRFEMDGAGFDLVMIRLALGL